MAPFILDIQIKSISLCFYIYLLIEINIYEDTTAMFANKDFLVLAYLRLALRRDNIEATTTRIAQDRHYCQAITIAAADALVSGKQTWVYLFFRSIRFHTKCFFFFFCFGDNLFQFSTLYFQC